MLGGPFFPTVTVLVCCREKILQHKTAEGVMWVMVLCDRVMIGEIQLALRTDFNAHDGMNRTV
jgi:hypothetical protein